MLFKFPAVLVATCLVAFGASKSDKIQKIPETKEELAPQEAQTLFEYLELDPQFQAQLLGDPKEDKPDKSDKEEKDSCKCEIQNARITKLEVDLAALLASFTTLDNQVNDDDTGIQDVLDDLHAQVNDSTTGIQDVLDDLNAQVNDATTGIQDVLDDLNAQINDATTGIQDVLDTLGEQVNDTDGIQDKLDDLYDQVNDAATGIVDKLDAVKDSQIVADYFYVNSAALDYLSPSTTSTYPLTIELGTFCVPAGHTLDFSLSFQYKGQQDFNLYLRRGATKVAHGKGFDRADSQLLRQVESILYREKVGEDVEFTLEIDVIKNPTSSGPNIQPLWFQWGFQVYGPEHPTLLATPALASTLIIDC